MGPPGPSRESATDNHIPTDSDTFNKELIMKVSSMRSRRGRLAEELRSLAKNGEVTLSSFLEPSPPKLSQRKNHTAGNAGCKAS